MSFSSKTYFPAKHSYLSTFSNDKAEILAVSLLIFALLDFDVDYFNFLVNSHFIIDSS